MAEVGPLVVQMKVDKGWRYRALMASAEWIGWLPDCILDPVVKWAVRGVKVTTKDTES